MCVYVCVCMCNKIFQPWNIFNKIVCCSVYNVTAIIIAPVHNSNTDDESDICLMGQSWPIYSYLKLDMFTQANKTCSEYGFLHNVVGTHF